MKAFQFLKSFPREFQFFSKNKLNTIVPRNEKNAKAYLGSVFRKGPSFGDVKLLNEMYGCGREYDVTDSG